MRRNLRLPAGRTLTLAGLFLMTLIAVWWLRTPAPVLGPAEVVSPSRERAPGGAGAAMSPQETRPSGAPIVAIPAVAWARGRGLPVEPLPPSQDEWWRHPAPETSLAAFQRWADHYVGLPPERRAAAEAEGVRLAAARRVDLQQLIERDPARALQRAVPETIRRQLPAAVTAQLEERVDARGHLTVTGATPAEGASVRWSGGAVVTRAEFGGRRLVASVYGRRAHQPSRWNVPLHGIAVDGRMAVSEWPARVLEPLEMKDALARRRPEPQCSASGQPAAAADTAVALQVAGEVEFFCRPSHAAEQLSAASASETLLPPGFGIDSEQPVIAASGGNGITVPSLGAQADADWTTGQKRIVVVRLTFDGANYHNLSEADCSEIVDRMSTSYQRWSYGKHSLRAVGQGSWVSPILDLPGDASSYDGDSIDGIWALVSLWLSAQGWFPGEYDYVLCLAGPAPIADPDDPDKNVWWSGLGQIGGSFTFLRTGGNTTEEKMASAASVGLHEVGHNLGLRHASSWWTTPQPIVTIGGTTYYQYGAEYGDRFDRMGKGAHDFNVRYKQWLHWLTDNEVPLGISDGVYRLREHDQGENGGVRGLQVPFTVPVGVEVIYQDALYVEYRTYPSNAVLRAGPTIRLASVTGPKAFLLDGTPETPNHEPDDDTSGNLDSPLPPGRTLTTERYGRLVHITNLETDPESGELEVMVVHGTPAGNSAPEGTIDFSVPSAAVGQKVYLFAFATDADGDPIGYNWQVPGVGALPNAFMVPVTFTTSGTKTIQCLLTDMHGGTRMLSRNLSVVLNQPPSITGLVDRSINEDTPVSVDFTVSDPTTPASLIGVTAVSGDQSLVADSDLVVTHLGGGNRRLTITPRPNQHGAVNISVTASDGTLIHVEKFDLTLRPVTPGTVWISRGSNWRYWDRGRAPSGGSGSWAGSAYDDSDWATGNARFVQGELLAPFGSTHLAADPDRVTCYFRRTFNVTVRPGGTPTLKLLCDDAAVVYLNGAEVWRQNLPAGPIAHTTRALTSVEGRDETAFAIIPLEDTAVRMGTNTLAIEVHDRGTGGRGGGDVSFDAEFALLQAPSLVAFADRSMIEDTALGFSFTNPADAESPSGGVTLTARSSNPAVVLASDIQFGFNNLVLPPRRTIAITPRPNATGQTEITVVASDGSSESWQKFLLTVTPVNDAPTVDPIPNRTTALGEIPAAVPVTVHDIDSPVGGLTVTATSSNPSLLPNTGIAVMPGDRADRRWLTFQPNPGLAAQSTIRVVVSDGQLASTSSFIFRVTMPLSVTALPARLLQSGDEWRYWVQALPTDPRGNPVDWTAADLDDRPWPAGRSRLGYGNAGLKTAIPSAPLRVTTYFRRSFTVTDPALFTQLNLRLLRDDGAAVYLNGRLIRTSNLPRGEIAPDTLATTAVDGAAEEAWENFTLSGVTGLRAGRNVVAVEVHQATAPGALQPGDLSFDLEMDGVLASPLASDALVAPGEAWRYWDRGVYPDETWRQAPFDDSGWAQGLARLGFGIGGESTVIQGGPTNDRHASVLFRKVFPVADPALYTSLHLFLQRDDGAHVYLNGTRVLTENLAATSTLGDFALGETSAPDQTAWRHFILDPKKLLRGGNLLAVELHQASATGADLNFDAQLVATVGGHPKLYLRPTATGLEASWPAAFNGWTLETSSDLISGGWQPVPQPVLLDGAWHYVRLPAGSPVGFFRLRQ